MLKVIECVQQTTFNREGYDELATHTTMTRIASSITLLDAMVHLSGKVKPETADRVIAFSLE